MKKIGDVVRMKNKVEANGLGSEGELYLCSLNFGRCRRTDNQTDGTE